MSHFPPGFKFPEGFNIIDELRNLTKTMIELRHLPHAMRHQILLEKMKDIMVRGGHPKYQKKDKD